MFVCLSVCPSVCVSVSFSLSHIYTHIYTHMQTHTQLYTRKHTCKHTHTHTKSWYNVVGLYKFAVARVTVWRSIIVSLYTEFFPSEQLLPLRSFQKKSVSQSIRNALKRIEMQEKFVYPLWVVFSFAAECSNFNTINRTEVPTFPPSLIKIQPIVTEI